MKVTIVVRGGYVISVYAPDGTEIEVIDFDNPSRFLVQPDGEECPQYVLDQIDRDVAGAETQDG